LRLNLVIDRFALISGLEPEEVSRWTPLCADAVVQIEGMKRSKVKDDEKTIRRLSFCAAALAYYKYTLFTKEAAVSSFSAGNLSVGISVTERERAKQLWEEELRGASDLLEAQSDFCFLGVRV